MKKSLKKVTTPQETIKNVTPLPKHEEDEMLSYAKEHASSFDVDFDALPNALKNVMVKSEELAREPIEEAMDRMSSLRDGAGIAPPVITPTGDPATFNMLDIPNSYPQSVQLYFENIINDKSWYNKIMESKNISDEIKYHISNAVNGLVWRNTYISFMNNYRVLCYSLVERFCKSISEFGGIEIDITSITSHPEFQKFITEELDAKGILEYLFNTTPIPIVVNYNDYTEYETIPSLHQLNNEEYEAVIRANAEVKSKTLTLSFYNVFNIALTDTIYASNHMNHYLDLSILFNYCMSYASMLFADFERQIRMLFAHPGTVANFNSKQSELRNGLVFELDE